MWCPALTAGGLSPEQKHPLVQPEERPDLPHPDPQTDEANTDPGGCGRCLSPASLRAERREGPLCSLMNGVKTKPGAPDFNATDGRAKSLGLWVCPGLTPTGPREKPHLQTAVGPPCPPLKQDFLSFQNRGGLTGNEQQVRT